MIDPVVWQLLAAAEAPIEKGRAFLERLDPSEFVTWDTFERSGLFTANELGRVKAVSGEALSELLKAGGNVLPPNGEIPALFVDGKPGCLSAPCIGIVGTRNASAYGKAVAKKFASAFAEAAATVISGGALGIDAASHEGALAAEGSTAAVLAGGVDKPYPTRNMGLFRRIKERGCLVSAYACGTLPQPYKFLERNRVIAALSAAVLVVEAPVTSGALSTALAAKEFGKPVFVVPSTIDTESFRGSHRLIRQGAILVDDPSQVLDALGLFSLRVEELPPVTGLAAQILSALSTKPMPPEKLAEKVGISPGELLAELTMLELDGRVIRDLGGYALVP